MKILNTALLIFYSYISLNAQSNTTASSLLDEVASTMGAYTTMYIEFNQTFSNEEAGIKETDEAPIKGSIFLQGTKYHLSYLGNTLLFDGKSLYIINDDEKEVSTVEGAMEEDDFISPSELLTFYKEGYTYEMGKLKNIDGRNIQFVTLNPMDSDSDIVKVELGIDNKTKHIFKMIQIGANSSKTIFTISNLKTNPLIPSSKFSFDKEAYEKMKYLID